LPKSRNAPTSKPGAESAPRTSEASGIYTWVIATDRVYADSLVAELFGLDCRKAQDGLPLQDHLSRIHNDDLPRVAKAIHHTMMSGQPFGEQYRICRPDGSVAEVMAIGTCFRDGSGEPSHYSGIIFPIAGSGGGENALLKHLLTAYDLARQDGKPALADKIVDALVEIGWQDTDACEHAGPLH
jgi:PAS domain-containing protein